MGISETNPVSSTSDLKTQTEEIISQTVRIGAKTFVVTLHLKQPGANESISNNTLTQQIQTIAKIASDKVISQNPKIGMMEFTEGQISYKGPSDQMIAASMRLPDQDLVALQGIIKAEIKDIPESLRELINEIQAEEIEYYRNKLTRYKDLSEKLKKKEKKASEIRDSFQQESLEKKKEFDIHQEQRFNQLKKLLVQMSEEYNHLTEELEALNSNDPKHSQLKKEQEVLLEKVNSLNAQSRQLYLSTHRVSNDKSIIMAYTAVVEKQLSLLEAIEKENNPKKLAQLQKELNKVPLLESWIDQTFSTIFQNGSLESIQDAKKHSQTPSILKWGQSHLNRALTDPTNWTNIYATSLKQSAEKRLYVSVTINQPLNIEKEGGVPAGLRDKKEYSQRATNLYQTTSYILDSQGNEHGKQISFRGGQFPTEESAKKALRSIQKNRDSQKPFNCLHINVLLTPTVFTGIKKDRTLLETHQKNIDKAIKETLPETALIFSNLGVNEGAVGEKKILFLKRLRLGWHTSIYKYTNCAAQELNKQVTQKLDKVLEQISTNPLECTVDDLDSLGPLLQVGQEMEAIWAKNDYANAKAGNHPFKLPALWKVMDRLLGIMSYVNCMSGKDRTGKVEEAAQEYSDEIAMNIADQKRRLDKTFSDLKQSIAMDTTVWEKYRTILTAACWKAEELGQLANDLKNAPQTFGEKVQKLLQKKTEAVKIGLGTNTNQSFMQDKGQLSGRTFTFDQDVANIPTNVPRIEQKTSKDAQECFPPFARTSIYQEDRISFEELFSTTLSSEKQKILENRQRIAINQRLSQLSGSLQITQVNTGKIGFRVEGGEPLARFSSGFDRDYVIYRLMHAETQKERSALFKELTGLNEIDTTTQEQLIAKMEREFSLNASSKTKAKRLISILRAIEILKLESLCPKSKVKR